MESKLRLTPRKIRSQMHYWVQDDVNLYELVLLKQDSRCNKKADQEKSCIAFKVYSQIKTSYTHILLFISAVYRHNFARRLSRKDTVDIFFSSQPARKAIFNQLVSPAEWN